MFKERNPLLTRDDIGKSKPSTYDLPENTHTYGVKNRREQFGVDKLTSQWHLPPLSQSRQAEKDYQKLNRMGVNAKVIKPYQVREFRQNLDVRVAQKKGEKRTSRVASVQEFNSVEINRDPAQAKAASAFGKANRAQTPVKGIITGSYGEEAENYYRQRSQDTVARRMNAGKKPRVKIGSTRAHELSAHMARGRASVDRDPYTGNAVIQQPVFKMKRFAEVQSKLGLGRGSIRNNAENISKSRPGNNQSNVTGTSGRMQTSLKEMQAAAAASAATTEMANSKGANLVQASNQAAEAYQANQEEQKAQE